MGRAGRERAEDERHRLAAEVEVARDFLRHALEDEQRDDRHRERRRADDAVAALDLEEPEHEVGDSEVVDRGARRLRDERGDLGLEHVAVGSSAWNGRRVVACEVFRFRDDAAWTTDDALAPEPLPGLRDLRAAWEAFCTTTRRRKLVLRLDDGSEVALFPFLRPGRVPAGLPAELYRFWVAAHGNPWELAVES